MLEYFAQLLRFSCFTAQEMWKFACKPQNKSLFVYPCYSLSRKLVWTSASFQGKLSSESINAKQNRRLTLQHSCFWTHWLVMGKHQNIIRTTFLSFSAKLFMKSWCNTQKHGCYQILSKEIMFNAFNRR